MKEGKKKFNKRKEKKNKEELRVRMTFLYKEGRERKKIGVKNIYKKVVINRIYKRRR